MYLYPNETSSPTKKANDQNGPLVSFCNLQHSWTYYQGITGLLINNFKAVTPASCPPEGK